MTDTQEHLLRVEAMGLEAGFWMVDTRRVNLDDFLWAIQHPDIGGVVRVEGGVDNAVKFMSGGGTPVDCIAGWMSEAA